MTLNSAIDFDHLEQYAAGDDELRAEILDIFSSQVVTLMEEFDVFQSDEEWHMTAHTLKGASRGVGAWSLGSACEDAEKLVGAAPAKQEARATILVSLRFLAAAAVAEAKQATLAEAS